MKRLEQLKLMQKENPEDPFFIYGLALEYKNIDLVKTKEYFDYLLHHHPNYLATYYQAGELYEDIDEEKAKDLYQKGMLLSKEQNNTHTYNELKSALDLLDM